MVNVLRSIGEIFRPRRAAEAKKTSNKLKEEGSDIKFATETATNVSDVIEYLLKLHSYKDKNEFKKHVDRNALSYLASLKDKFVLLKSKLDEAEKANPSVKDLAIVRFCRSIAENDELHKELGNLAKKCRNDGIHKKLNVLAKKYRNVPHATSYERLYPQLDKIVGNLNKDKLKEKISFLKKLKEKSDFNAIRNGYSNAWNFDNLLRGLMGDKKFKEEYIDKALDEEGESFSKSFKKDLNEYIELANHGEAAARKCLGEEVELQTYYTQINDTDRALNINIISRDKTEPTKISDLLQKEENTSQLNIYYKKKHEVRAYRDEKGRHYEFKEGASYEMTSTWRAEDESGNTSICKMVMNVSSDGITKVLKFDDGKESKLQRGEFLELVKQNDELYIQGCSLYDSVEKWLRSQSGESLRVTEKSKKKGTVTTPDVVPIADNSSQKDKIIEVKQNPNDKGTDTNQDFKSSTVAVVCDTLASEVTKTSKTEIAIQTEVGSQQIKDELQKITIGTQTNQTKVSAQQAAAETQTEISTQQIAIQTEVSSQQIATQTEFHSQQTGTQTQTEISTQHIAVQTEVGSQQIATQTEVNLQQTGTQTQTEISTQQVAIQTEVGLLQMDELANLEQKVSNLERENVELKQGIEAGLQVMDQKHHELMQESRLLQKALKATQEENKELNQELSEISEENELLNNKVGELYRERDDLYEVRCDLQDELERNKQEFIEEKGLLNHRIADGQERIVQFMKQYGELENKLAETKQIIKELKQQNSDLQTEDIKTIERLEGKNARLRVEKNKMREELVQSKKEHEEKAKELDSMYEKKRKAERELGALNKENSQLKDKVKILEKDVSTAEEETLRVANERDEIEENFRCHMLKDIEAIGKLEEQNSTLKAKNDKVCEELAKLKKEQKEGTKELEGACEEKENVEKKLGVLSQQNVALNSIVKKLTEDLTKAEEYAEYLMGEKSKAVQGLKSQMSGLEQNYKEQLKSSAKSVEEQAWKFKELQNELERKKETFQKAERAYRELEGKYKELEKTFNAQQVEMGFLRGYKSTLAERLVYIDGLDMIAKKTQDIENLTKQNEDLTKEVESLKKCVERFIEDNTAAAGIKHLIKTNPDNYKLTQDVENIILSTQLPRPPSSDSYDDALNSKSVYPLNRINPKKIFNSTDTQKMNKIFKDHEYAFDALAEAVHEVVRHASQEVVKYAPSPKKQPLSKSSSSSSVDSGCGSDKENCGNRSSGPSGFGPISRKVLIERAARSTSSSPNVVARSLSQFK